MYCGLLASLVALRACGAEEGGRAAEAAAAVRPERVNAAHLPNAYRLHPRVISGGEPDGEAGFRELQSLGVRTIISVDGARPDVPLAARFGLRYVHLPHGYDGIPTERVAELAKAVRELPGPVYIHCHHGKHRSPAAATAACIAAGLLEPSDAETILSTAGTSRNYRGLYEAAQSSRRIDDALLDALEADFPETASLPPLAEAMVAIERVHDHLGNFDRNGWQPLPDEPDLDPPHEALLLREQFTELLRSDETRGQDPRFQRLLREAETTAADLETALRAGRKSAAAAVLKRITAECAACHREFRDIPLSEKPQAR